MSFKIIGEIRTIEPIALGHSVRVRVRLRKMYGGLRWRKLKGIAEVTASAFPDEEAVNSALRQFLAEHPRENAG